MPTAMLIARSCFSSSCNRASMRISGLSCALVNPFSMSFSSGLAPSTIHACRPEETMSLSGCWRKINVSPSTYNQVTGLVLQRGRIYFQTRVAISDRFVGPVGPKGALYSFYGGLRTLFYIAVYCFFCLALAMSVVYYDRCLFEISEVLTSPRCSVFNTYLLVNKRANFDIREFMVENYPFCH